jgi:hypothetical protein
LSTIQHAEIRSSGSSRTITIIWSFWCFFHS